MHDDEARMSNDEAQKMRSKPLVISSFGLNSSFVLCDSSTAASNLNLTASPRLFDESSGSAPNLLPHTRLRRNKLRRKPGKQADQIVRDQNLSVAMLA